MSDFDFSSLFGDSKIDIDCPNCNRKITFSLNDVGKTIKCPKCSTLINLKKDSSFDNSVKSVDKSLKELENAFKKFGK